mmetsp:Transcript_37389/g.88395  ORF Transcript_37389/g.88395 Transcript_37389/m.88395 type:complete len:422 (+) Transcript_37389:199-1464(+)
MALLNPEEGNRHLALPAPLFRLFQEVETGTMNPLALQRAVKNIRAKQLTPSVCRHIDPPVNFEVSCMAIDEVEDRYLLCGYADGSLALLDVEERPSPAHHKFECVIQKERSQGHNFAVTGVSWYPNDTGLFVSGGFDKAVKAWDTNRAEVAFTFPMPDKVHCVQMPAVAHRHNLIAVGSADRRVYLCDLASGGSQHALSGHSEAVNCVAWSDQEFVLASGGMDGTLRIWDIRRTASWLAMLSYDEGPRIRKRRRPEDGQEGAGVGPTAHEGGVSALMFSPDGRHLLSSGVDAKLRLWNPRTFELQLVNFGSFHQSATRAYKKVQIAVEWDSNIVYHPRGNYVIGCDIASGQRVTTLRGHLDTVKCVVAQPRRETLLSAGKDSNILVWTPPQTGFGPRAGEDDATAGLGQGQADEDAWSDGE